MFKLIRAIKWIILYSDCRLDKKETILNLKYYYIARWIIIYVYIINKLKKKN